MSQSSALNHSATILDFVYRYVSMAILTATLATSIETFATAVKGTPAAVMIATSTDTEPMKIQLFATLLNAKVSFIGHAVLHIIRHIT